MHRAAVREISSHISLTESLRPHHDIGDGSRSHLPLQKSFTPDYTPFPSTYMPQTSQDYNPHHLTQLTSAFLRKQTTQLTNLLRTRLDAYSRRHEARKIYLWQSAARRTIQNREAILQGQRPQQYHMAQLTALDQQLRAELSRITDQGVFDQLRAADYSGGCWIAEDPGLGEVLRWFRDRR